MDKSTLKFYLIGDTDADALGALCRFGFQRGKAGHGGFGFQNFGQRLELDVRYRAFLWNVLRSRARRRYCGC